MQTPVSILRKYWGYEHFRPLQEDIIQSVLDGQDTLALLPTGGGKSICYQVPALLMDGICIVVSPLIALMKDQVTNLQKRDIPAVAIYAGMPYPQIDRILDNCVYGNTKLLYLSPERLVTDLALERIKKMNVNLIAVDEAHCISQWGYDFRPPYQRIAELREWHPDTPVLALTATATPEVVNDIQEQLNFNKPHVLQTSFARNNLAYVVLNEQNKNAKLVDIIKKVPGTGIVYANSRRATKDYATLLQRHHIKADFYNAGLNNEERSRKQEAWMKGEIRVMVCTNAFGMGIDKPNVRSVVHMNLPNSLEAYFQEAGRAGRDRKKAYAVLLYNENDKGSLEYFYEKSFPPMEDIRRVYRALGSYFQLAVGGGFGNSFDFEIGLFVERFKIPVLTVFHSLKLLEQAGWLVLTDAIFIPSVVKVRVSKTEIYDYQLKHPKLDLAIKTLLRSSTGIMHNYVSVREAHLARYAKLSVPDFTRFLKKLNQDKVINYQPAKSAPQVIFTQDRIDADNLTIDQKLYNFRKNRYLVRMRKAIGYAETPYCRSQQLLSYFGEKNAPRCGICDVCLGRTKMELTEEEFARFQQKIKDMLQRDQLSSQELVESFLPKWQDRVRYVLEQLIEAGELEIVAEKLQWKN
ncbi:MAG: ATP-dependent DNA helicase RecQ [Saprospiraceae bacterium]